jgi:uncharacterized protein YndB with AHSA1/START domain
MPDTMPALTVRKSLTVHASIAHAFAVFTTGFDSWWPRAHHIGTADLLAAVIEPRAGGRWFEKGVDGSECEWGTVLVYEPPSRVVLSWHLNGEWQYDPDPSHASEVDVRFIPDGPGRTKVEFEHRHIERAVGAEQLRSGVDSPQGWTGLLELFAARAKESAA